jgi:hypothetical protein
MTNTKIIFTILSLGEHLLLIAALIASHVFYSMCKIQKHTIHIYRGKVRDLVAEIMALEKEKK